MQILKAIESDYQTYGLSVLNDNEGLYDLLNKHVSVCMNDSSIMCGKFTYTDDIILELELINKEEIHLDKKDINFISEKSIFESFQKLNV